MIASAIHQHESAIKIHMSFSLELHVPSHPSRLSQNTGILESQSKCPQSKCPLAIFLHVHAMVMYMFQCYSLKSSHPFPTVSKSLFITSVSPLLPCQWDHQYYLSIFHIYALICDMSLSLYELLHSV